MDCLVCKQMLQQFAISEILSPSHLYKPDIKLFFFFFPFLTIMSPCLLTSLSEVPAGLFFSFMLRVSFMCPVISGHARL